jgi:hypothetical protein
VVKKLMGNVIHATILKGKFKGEEVLIPRIPMIPTDMPFEFKRIQFPIRLAFAMTINKSQGQSLNVCGLNLENKCFSHGQLYVACSRVGKPSALFVLAPDNKTKNVVGISGDASMKGIDQSVTHPANSLIISIHFNKENSLLPRELHYIFVHLIY